MRVEKATPDIPDDSLWPRLSAPEREHRRAVLAGIRRRVAEDGPRVACDYPGRGQEFKPFAALKGYDELVEQRMREDPEADR